MTGYGIQMFYRESVQGQGRRGRGREAVPRKAEGNPESEDLSGTYTGGYISGAG